MAFRQLRQVFNIDAGDYMLSVCGVFLPASHLSMCKPGHRKHMRVDLLPVGMELKQKCFWQVSLI